MKIIQKSPDILVIKTETILSTALGVGGLFLTCLAVYSFIVHYGTIQDRIYYGQAGGAITLLVMAIALFEQSVFVFDREKRLLTWKRRSALKKLSGTLSFDMIKSITVQNFKGSDDLQSARVAIISYTEEIPLTKSYTGDTDEVTKLAEILNKWVLTDSSVTFTHGDDSLADGSWINDLKIDSGDKESLFSIIALIMLLCGPLFLILGMYGFFKATATQNWIQTEGVVISSGLHAETEDYEYHFEIKYSYTVNGIQYQSNALYMKAIMNKNKAYSVINKFYLKDYEVINPKDYPPGNIITIYYDPDDHQSAVVIPGVSGGIWAIIILGVFFTLIYLYLARRDLRSRGSKQQKMQK